MSYTKKNINLNKKFITINKITYKSFTISNLPKYYQEIPLSQQFNSKGLTYINTNYIK